MNRRCFLVASFCFLLTVFVVAPRALALNESTHELVNREAATSSTVDAILKSNLGFSNGLRETFQGTTALRWLELGGRFEDQGNLLNLLFGRARYTRHFHDPLQPWDTAGLRFFGQSESSVRWMQRADQGSQAVGGTWGWPTARQRFYESLTESTTKTREERFADLFRALGQLMHLVTDASVPTGANVTLGPANGFAEVANANLDNAGAEG